jgi:HK97 family phage major capsid protein
MAVASNIGRSDVSGVIPELYSNQFLDVIIAESAALSAFRTIRLGTKTNTFPVLSALPAAGFVTEDPTNANGVKPKSQVQWSNKTITAEEVAVIIPIHENVIEDSTVDLWAQIRPLVGQAFGQVIDDAIMYGTGKPASWRAGLIPSAISAGAVSQLSGGVDLIDGFNEAFEYVEADGNDVNTVIAGPRMRSRLRGLRDVDGQLIYASIKDGNGSESVYGASLYRTRNGVWDDAEALALCVDASKVVVGLRSDMSYKLLTEATLGTGADALNLAERDMVALRVKMRLGWEVATNATALNASPVPFSVVLAEEAGS